MRGRADVELQSAAAAVPAGRRGGEVERLMGSGSSARSRSGDGRPVSGRRSQGRALLADLLVDAGPGGAGRPADRRPVGRCPAGDPLNALQGRVSRLRRALGPGVAGRPLAARLPAGGHPEAVDAAGFERLTAEARRRHRRRGRAVGAADQALFPGCGGGRPWPSSPIEPEPRRRRPVGRAPACGDRGAVDLGWPRAPAELVGELEGAHRRPPARGGGAGSSC